ncbi:GAF domain-containing protein [Arthrobacter sp. KBS0703]|uniref:GAF domain-containing protein n=1 Tax=Arthrobacter sp. KBS0703 TaxID=1955698 RepID=UPI0009C59205|nr:GAF domain-containing protein [Arthrobacter sp. KBS0703]
MRRADRLEFAEGADWSEAGIGTNAISEALVTGRPVKLFSAGHLVRTHHEWACTAAPITDPATGRLLGVLDVSGPLDTISADTPRMVRCAVGVAESLLGTSDGDSLLGCFVFCSCVPAWCARPWCCGVVAGVAGRQACRGVWLTGAGYR